MAFCPHPPLLVPQVAHGAAAELDDLRAACRTAIKRAASSAPQLVVLGVGERSARYAPNARGSLAAYGVPIEIPLGSDEPGPVGLPLSLTIAAYLLRDALGPDCGAVGYSISARERQSPALDDTPVALLVMGDGSARRSTTAPGYLDERAAGFDADVAAALSSGRGDCLAIDGWLADQLLAAGAPAWNAAGRLLRGRSFDAELLYEDAPYGVGYFVAVWTGDG
ncbi:MAG TPA: hypothetical protein VG868_04175 [Casimicrobiaceae bacterium]|nr:hypothetical protein [Casimicrobiaceae bacterium]